MSGATRDRRGRLIDPPMPGAEAHAWAQMEVEQHRREKAEQACENYARQNAALWKQLRAVARWADLSGNHEVLKVMQEALR